MAGPNIYSIPAGVSFVDALARTLIAEHDGDPLALSRLRILLPTRRATRTLREAFLRAGAGTAMVLPRMQPIGDVDEDELLLTGFAGDDLDIAPPIPSLERTLLLSRLVAGWRKAKDGQSDEPAQSFQLAAELARFLDQMQTEGKAFRDLATLVPEAFASHWGLTLDFLRIVGEAWPEILAERGWLDPAARRDALLRALATRWTESPPPFPVIAAGSTGSIPASAALIRTIAFMPGGRVVLPGLDRTLEQDDWDALGQTHPQFGMKQLLARMGVDRSEVEPWPDATPANPARIALLTEAMRPPETTAKWQDRKLDKQKAVDGLIRVEAPTQQDEAGAIALILREALETPGRTAALITPDRRLARRVAAALRRWDIEIDDSAGVPLPQTPVATFLRLLAEMVADDFAPVPLLSALKHPLAAGGEPPARFRAHVRDLERAILRGPRPAPGADGIRQALLDENKEALAAWWDGLCAGLAPLLDAFARADVPLAELVSAHIRAAEALATTDQEPGITRLWRGEDGEAAAGFLEELRRTIEDMPPIVPRHYPALFDVAMADRVVRPPYGAHPRLAILGPLEARLHHADVVVLGGLNEASWPPDAGTDPWMSRPMKAQFGLPLPERRIGLSAHDFVQAAAAPLVYLTRAEKVDGEPTIPSRWLLRLDAVLDTTEQKRAPHLAWHQGLDVPAEVRPCAPPAPTPPVQVRPKKLSVTQVETWMRDPYALYARHILRLKVLDPLDADPGAADRGSFIHDALERFLDRHPDSLPPNALDQLLDCGREAFGPMLNRPTVRAFWWPRFEQIAAWFLDQQRERMGSASPVATERSGALDLGNFTLTARADRIDRRVDGTYEIIDYKTGGAPTARQLTAGYGAQMPLEAVMLEAGAFENIPGGRVAELSWWLLKGDASRNVIDQATRRRNIPSIEELAEAAAEGLRKLITAFDDEKTAYHARPNPMEQGYGDYDHLARVREWDL